MNSWFAKFISLDEMKSSSLVISFLVFSGIAIYLLIMKGEIPQNLTTLLTIQIGVIGGVNTLNYISNNMAMSKNNQQIPMQNNMYGSNMNGYNSYGSNGMGMINQPMGIQQSMPVQSVPIVATQTSTTTTTVSPQNRGI